MSLRGRHPIRQNPFKTWTTAQRTNRFTFGKSFIFITGADPKRYRDLHKQLEDSLALGGNKYPATLADALTVLTKFGQNNKPSKPSPNHNKDNDSQQKGGNKEEKSYDKNENDDDEGPEGATIVQQNVNNDKPDAEIPQAEMQLLQQAVEEDAEDDETPMHFLFT